MKAKPETDSAPLLTTADFANLSLLEPCPPLQRLLESATVVGSDEMPHTVVTMNSQVLLHDETTGARRVVRVVFPGDADAGAGLISVMDPLGVRLLSSSQNQVIECDLADGVHRLRVEQVIYQPEYSLRTNLVTRS